MCETVGLGDDSLKSTSECKNCDLKASYLALSFD